MVGMPLGVLHRVPGPFAEGGHAGYGDLTASVSPALARIRDNHEKASRTLGVCGLRGSPAGPTTQGPGAAEDVGRHTIVEGRSRDRASIPKQTRFGCGDC